MNQVKNLEKLSHLSYFDKDTLSQFIDISDNSLYADIKRWLKKGLLLHFKNGLYVTGAFVNAQKDINAYLEFIANKLREPSYLSMEYVLQKYSILSESVFGHTSVTLKSSREYKNKFGLFTYRNIKDELFDGYQIENQGKFSIKVATKAKALFDYFYYRLPGIDEINARAIGTFRLNLEGFSRKDLIEFKCYCETARTKKMDRLSKLIGRIK